MPDRTLTLALMDAPYEAAASTTAFRIIAAALAKDIAVNVFAYEGAVCLTQKDQAPHANPVKGTTVEQEEHPTTKDLVAGLMDPRLDLGELRALRGRARRRQLDRRGQARRPAGLLQDGRRVHHHARDPHPITEERHAHPQHRRDRVPRHPRGAGRHRALAEPGAQERRRRSHRGAAGQCRQLRGPAIVPAAHHRPHRHQAPRPAQRRPRQAPGQGRPRST